MIRLDNGWIIDADICGYTLAREVEAQRKNKDGEMVATTELRDATYHRTISQAATAHLRRVQRELVRDGDYDLRTGLAALTRLTEAVQCQFSEEV